MFGELFDAQRDGGQAAGYPPLLCTWLEAVALSCFTRAGRPLRAGHLSEAERRAVADFLCALYRDSAPESGRLTLPLSPVIAPDGVPVEVRLSVLSALRLSLPARLRALPGARHSGGGGQRRGHGASVFAALRRRAG